MVVRDTNNYGIRRMIGFINSSLQTHTYIPAVQRYNSYTPITIRRC
jgi:hypothetical protein